MRYTSGVEIVKRIDELLSERNETRVDLCKYLQIKTNTISNWFIRDTVPKVSDIYNIADYLGVSAEYLAFGVQTENNESLSKLSRKISRLNDIEKIAVETLIDGFLSKK